MTRLSEETHHLSLSLYMVQVDRSRSKFLSGLFVKLNHYCDHQSITGSHGSHPLAIHRLKVTFSGEPGEGSGVLRSMFTAAAEVLVPTIVDVVTCF